MNNDQARRNLKNLKKSDIILGAFLILVFIQNGIQFIVDVWNNIITNIFPMPDINFIQGSVIFIVFIILVNMLFGKK